MGVKPKRKFSDFIPLIVIFAIVIVLTIVSSNLWGRGVTDSMRFFMGYFFLIFGTFKVIKLKGFADAYSTYDLLAMRSTTYGYVYPFIELGLAFLFLSGFFLLWANAATLVIMAIGALGVYLKLLQKEEIPCACLGVVFKIPMTWVTLIEDLLMVLMAALMLFVI